MGNAFYNSSPITPLEANDQKENEIAIPDRFLEKIVSFHAKCITCERDFIPRSRSALLPGPPPSLTSRTLAESLQQISRYKFSQQQKLFLYLQDAYAQDMFEFYMVELLRDKPFTRMREEIEKSKTRRPSWTGASAILDALNVYEANFQSFCADVIEHRLLTEIASSQSPLKAKTTIKTPSHWADAFANARQIIEIAKNQVKLQVEVQGEFVSS
jgi:hypothetical protein